MTMPRLPNERAIADDIDRLLAGKDRDALSAYLVRLTLGGVPSERIEAIATERMAAVADHAVRRYWTGEACDCLPGAHPN